MAQFFNFNDYQLIQQGSECYRGEENSIDLYWSSPPFYDQEIYSESINQAYNKGRDHFYNSYWRKTLENIKFMLKTGKWFGINVNDDHYKMVEIAQEYFGDIREKVKLISFRGYVQKQQKKRRIYFYVCK